MKRIIEETQQNNNSESESSMQEIAISDFGNRVEGILKSLDDLLTDVSENNSIRCQLI